jgi:hypothetical protein
MNRHRGGPVVDLPSGPTLLHQGVAACQRAILNSPLLEPGAQNLLSPTVLTLVAYGEFSKYTWRNVLGWPSDF